MRAPVIVFPTAVPKTKARMAMLSREDVERRVQHLLTQEDLLFEVPVPLMALYARLGIALYTADLPQPKLAGLILRREGRWSIYVSASQPLTRQRFTVAHELGHYLLHLQDAEAEHVAGYKDRLTSLLALREDRVSNPREQEANRFAAALLMPKTLVTACWRNSTGPEDLAQTFRVSRAAMDIRLRELHLRS